MAVYLQREGIRMTPEAPTEQREADGVVLDGVAAACLARFTQGYNFRVRLSSEPLGCVRINYYFLGVCLPVVDMMHNRIEGLRLCCSNIQQSRLEVRCFELVPGRPRNPIYLPNCYLTTYIVYLSPVCKGGGEGARRMGGWEGMNGHVPAPLQRRCTLNHVGAGCWRWEGTDGFCWPSLGVVNYLPP
ncbi:hypothetical protein LX32DRAFT_184280 [Colletotrichum zoysiae]|uniref:Uncharacterized protein n=1 Tax=Colletotrichum zoysiae TaxID=1216348 RepID=A0AAD9H5D3_9PEZI|nr:hypothetical protein LX32DRAFT_184280 [Colletotrichum zoysiae]